MSINLPNTLYFRMLGQEAQRQAQQRAEMNNALSNAREDYKLNAQIEDQGEQRRLKEAELMGAQAQAEDNPQRPEFTDTHLQQRSDMGASGQRIDEKSAAAAAAMKKYLENVRTQRELDKQQMGDQTDVDIAGIMQGNQADIAAGHDKTNLEIARIRAGAQRYGADRSSGSSKWPVDPILASMKFRAEQIGNQLRTAGAAMDDEDRYRLEKEHSAILDAIDRRSGAPDTMPIEAPLEDVSVSGNVDDEQDADEAALDAAMQRRRGR